ncbi:angiotensinogen isoform X2 [Apus apus]|uniref:angiotensinogen isoform X2 n=1 Tax=Apus apus TaxID=8895 RepID=UPI0021F8B240|nr:angiotensinogen isoform X2 [Apus apus]
MKSRFERCVERAPLWKGHKSTSTHSALLPGEEESQGACLKGLASEGQHTPGQRRTPWKQFFIMKLAADLLCFLACLTAVTCDRVYVHPFNLFSFNKSTCEELESLAQEEKKTFVPVSIESQATPAYEDDLNDKDKLEAPSLSGRGRQKLSYLKDFVYVLGMRFYSELRGARRGQNVLLSPTSLYGSLVSFYLGASNQTAVDLQGLLGFVPPSGDPDCTSRVDGHKVLSSLRTIESLIKSQDEGLLFSKALCLFSAPGVPLYQAFVQDLVPSTDVLYVRAVDFTNPGEAAKQINAFVEAKNKGQSKCLLTDTDPSADLLFVVDVRLAVNVKQASQLKEPQEFWVDSNTKVLVPMLSLTGTFKYKTDASGTFSVVEVPISKTALLVLLQPIDGSTLEHVESQLPVQSSTWLQQLSPREIKLTLPELTVEDSFDLQELLADMELPTLLGKGADLSKISDSDLTVGKVINKAFFKLTSDGTDQTDDPTAQKEDLMFLEVTLNKPFLLAVFEEKSQAILFLGRVTNPLHGI